MNDVRAVRITLAFLLAPASPVLAYFVILPKSPVLIVGLSVSYVVAAFVGVPLFFRARKRGQVTSNVCIRRGLVAGASFPLVLAAGLLVGQIVTSQPIGLLALIWLGVGGAVMYGFLGAIGGYVFYLLAGFKPANVTRDLHGE